jgi:hypothetical protein
LLGAGFAIRFEKLVVRVRSLQKEKAPIISERSLLDFNAATTYSPTHFRVQYNRPSGA